MTMIRITMIMIMMIPVFRPVFGARFSDDDDGFFAGHRETDDSSMSCLLVPMCTNRLTIDSQDRSGEGLKPSIF